MYRILVAGAAADDDGYNYGSRFDYIHILCSVSFIHNNVVIAIYEDSINL